MEAAERGFLAAMQADSTDTSRLVYADWLDEQGRTDEAAMARSEPEGISGPPRRRWNHRYGGSGGSGGPGGDGGYGGYGGYDGSGGSE